MITHQMGKKKKLPIDYITNRAPFLDLCFYVDHRVFCPRPETEELVLLAEERLRKRRNRRGKAWVLDAGCGSGCIGISFALRNAGFHILLADISRDALDVAKENSCKYSTKSPLFFLQTDLTRGAFRPKSLTAIISNPPYIAWNEWHLMDEEVFAEPRVAWDGGPDGLAFIKPFVSRAHDWLESDGVLIMECGYAQAEAVRELLFPFYQSVQIKKDLAGIQRYLIAQKL